MERSKVPRSVERHFQAGTFGPPRLISTHCRVVLRTNSPKAGWGIAFRWAVVRRGRRTPLSLAWTSSMADVSMVSPPMTVWAVAGRAKRTRAVVIPQTVSGRYLGKSGFIGR